MESVFKTHFSSFILKPSFPCIMAKAVMNKGFFHCFSLAHLNAQSVPLALKNIYEFVDEMKRRNRPLSSCALVIEDEAVKKFSDFEKYFWDFLKALNLEDKKNYSPDPTVDCHPEDCNFSYSIKSESFFIIALHPESPRWSRRFSYPAIIFNPHRQFEDLRKSGTFNKIRDLIRQRDKSLQGSENKMLQNFGERSEVFQYLGRMYKEGDSVPLAF